MDFEKIKSNTQKKIQETKRSLSTREEIVPQIMLDLADRLDDHLTTLSTVENINAPDRIKEIQKKYEELIFDRVKEFDFKTKECEQFLDALVKFYAYIESLEVLEAFPVDASFFDDSNSSKLYELSTTVDETNYGLLIRMKQFHHLWKKEAIDLEESLHDLMIKNKEFLINTWNNLNANYLDGGSYITKMVNNNVDSQLLSQEELLLITNGAGLIELENRLKRQVKDAQVKLIENRKQLENFALTKTIAQIKQYEGEGGILENKWNSLETKIKTLTTDRDIASYKLDIREKQRTVFVSHMIEDLGKLNKSRIRYEMKEKLIKELEGFIERDEIIDNRNEKKKLSLEEEEMLEDKYKIYKRLNKLGEYREGLEKTIYSDMAPRMSSNQQLLDKILKEKKDLENKVGRNNKKPPELVPVPEPTVINDLVVKSNAAAIKKLQDEVNSLTTQSTKKKNTTAIEDLRETVKKARNDLENPSESLEDVMKATGLVK